MLKTVLQSIRMFNAFKHDQFQASPALANAVPTEMFTKHDVGSEGPLIRGELKRSIAGSQLSRGTLVTLLALFAEFCVECHLQSPSAVSAMKPVGYVQHHVVSKDWVKEGVLWVYGGGFCPIRTLVVSALEM